MATNTGYKFGSWEAAKYNSGTDVTAIAVNDDAGLTSDALSVDQKAAFQLGFNIYEDNTGAINGVCTIAILTTPDDSTWEDAPGLANAQVGQPYKFAVTPVQNDRVYLSPVFNAKDFGPNPKFYFLNECGQQVAITVKIRTADIPAASA